MEVSMDSLNNKESLFIYPELIQDNSLEISIFQNNTIHAFSPLYIPDRVQVLGVESENNQCRKGITSYKVQEGENLSSIASKFGISIDTIVLANDLNNNRISPGQDLIILPVSGIYHMAKPGETASGIANKYSVDKEDILFCNEIEEVMTGDILVIPGGKMPKPEPAPSRSTPSTLSRPSTPLISETNPSWLIPPTSGYISQRLHPHNAVDIANNCGTPIYASASGRIQRTGYHNVAGYYIRIEHSNGIVTFYGHLSGIAVSVGQNVSQGSLIGYMGNTGYTIGPTGCHLHFEVRGGTNPFGRYPLNHRF